jgi:hypothetical protein
LRSTIAARNHTFEQNYQFYFAESAQAFLTSMGQENRHTMIIVKLQVQVIRCFLQQNKRGFLKLQSSNVWFCEMASKLVWIFDRNHELCVSKKLIEKNWECAD